MKKFTRWGIILLVVFIAIQFIHPPRNNYPVNPAHTLGYHYPVPPQVDILLKVSCYDCHSNHTAYPWYNRVQPVAWYLSGHVSDGKRHLNFDEFATYTISRQQRMLQHIAETVNEGSMPMGSYTLIHGNARLNSAQRRLIVQWADSLRKALK